MYHIKLAYLRFGPRDKLASSPSRLGRIKTLTRRARQKAGIVDPSQKTPTRIVFFTTIHQKKKSTVRLKDFNDKTALYTESESRSPVEYPRTINT